VKGSMSSVESHEIDSLRAFTALIEDLRDQVGGVLWYRGCRLQTHTLLPSLYRRTDIESATDFLKLEGDILTRFKQRSIPYQNRTIAGNWDYLFLMQHHGVPTRLLDWTENPYIALFFALDGNVGNTEGAAVWVADPGAWNRGALKHMSYTGGVLSVDDDEAKGYAPESGGNLMNNLPIAVYGAHNSPRIVAQRGVFTVFGKEHQAMESMYEAMEFTEKALSKIVLPAKALESLHTSILQVGFTSSVVYPDLDGLAREIKWEFGFRG